MAADMAAVIEAVRAAIEDAANAPRPTNYLHSFSGAYGPGLKGISGSWINGQAVYEQEGLFFVHARRYGNMGTHETSIVVSILPDNDNLNRPYVREALDDTTQAILAAVEAEFLAAGASLHYEGYDNNQIDAPWRWYMTWVWDRRD